MSKLREAERKLETNVGDFGIERQVVGKSPPTPHPEQTGSKHLRIQNAVIGKQTASLLNETYFHSQRWRKTEDGGTDGQEA